MLISPVIIKEFRTLVRSRAAFWFLFGLLGFTGLYFIFLWSRLAAGASISERAALSRDLFFKLAVAQFCSLGLIAPVMASTVVTVERENRTLDLLLCTGVTRFNILFSKWLSTIAYQVLLVVCMLPILSLTLQLGGVGADEYVAAGVVVFQAVLVYGMVGLACSCWFRRSASASMASLFIVLGLVILPPLFYAVGFFNPGSGFRRGAWMGAIYSVDEQLMLALSPITALDPSRPTAPAASGAAALFADPIVRFHFLFQALFFFFASYLAWKGIGRKESVRAAVAKKIIDDPALLERRRSNWPFYLIDPLKRAQRIRDGENPVYVKEQRVGLLSRPHVLIRLSYIGLFISAALSFAALQGDTFTALGRVAQAGLVMALLMGPVVASPTISREREEKTLDLLLATPLPASRIVFGKYLIALRFMAAMAASAIALPLVAHLMGGFLMRGRLLDGRFNFFDIPKIFPPVISFLALYAAVAVYCSAAFRRNVMAIATTYGVFALMSVGGALVTFAIARGVGRYDRHSDLLAGSLFSMIASVVAPVVSPFSFFNLGRWFNDGMPSYYYRDPRPSAASYWIVIALQFVATLFVSWVILRLATRRLEKSSDK